MSPCRQIVPLEDAPAFELEEGMADPSSYTVVGAADFVFGRVSRLLVDLEGHEVVYLVVNTRTSSYREERGEERLLPIAWAQFLHHRRQVRLPHLSRYAFRALPLYQPDAPVPEAVEFPSVSADDPDLRDIA